jgi:hypothetical protein
MSAQVRGLVLALIGMLALAACTTTDLNSRADAPPASPEPASSPRVVPKIAAVPKIVAAPKPDQSAPNWSHVPEPVSIERFDRDKANCTNLANSAPGTGSPEMKFDLAFTKCMRSAGYEQNNNSSQ